MKDIQPEIIDYYLKNYQSELDKGKILLNSEVFNINKGIATKVKNSGIYYYNCPLCNEPFGSGEWSREYPYSVMDGYFECYNCNKKFYSSHKFENIVTVYDYEQPLFQTHDMTLGNEYKLHKMQYGKEVL